MKSELKMKALVFISIVFFSIVLDNIYNYFFESNLIISTLIFVVLSAISYKLIYKK